MNTEDRFIQAKATLHPKLLLRSELHSVRLSSARDLWYDGGGAFQRETFGYLGRPSGGHRRIGLCLDLSAEVAVSPRSVVTLYAGMGRGGAVPAALFPTGQKPLTHLVSIELVRRF
jgi:hypothetical protein